MLKKNNITNTDIFYTRYSCNAEKINSPNCPFNFNKDSSVRTDPCYYTEKNSNLFDSSTLLFKSTNDNLYDKLQVSSKKLMCIRRPDPNSLDLNNYVPLLDKEGNNVFIDVVIDNGYAKLIENRDDIQKCKNDIENNINVDKSDYTSTNFIISTKCTNQEFVVNNKCPGTIGDQILYNNYPVQGNFVIVDNKSDILTKRCINKGVPFPKESVNDTEPVTDIARTN